ncbi:MAG: glutamate--tRNA ligase [Chitinophagaceae bacterium]|nr:glutamate--tRNA ligase [Chitinophagaceae bacterium]
MSKKVRVRFAPSPTGGLHLGGVRTVLFNYLFARQQGGDFILRIEDTDQGRFVPGAEAYILDTLEWCGLVPDESPRHGGPFGPYRQSERKAMYRPYAEQLIQQGHAYYAFDTPQELEKMREQFKSDTNPSPQYDRATRLSMKNSLTLSAEAVQQLLAAGTPHVIRILMPENETVQLTDMIRGEISFETSTVDDKVLIKADGMPTYHLAVVVDDHLMQISHAFRGEEWLPSAPVHVLLWKYLGWENEMPVWAHLPLILKPDGHGKLSKRDGERLGFPVFAMNWTDPGTGETTRGYKETGFLPEAFVNMLALLGWNAGNDQEIFSMEELIQAFSMSRVHKGGARFDYEKAKWFNHEWIKQTPAASLRPHVATLLQEKGINSAKEQSLESIIELVKDRCTLLPDFVAQTVFFFENPSEIDLASIQPKWNEQKNMFFIELIRNWELNNDWTVATLTTSFQELAAANHLKPGELMLPLRIMLVGGKFGPGVFDIAAIIGKEATLQRIQHVLAQLPHPHP